MTPITYRKTVLTYPGLSPFFILESLNGEWNYLMGTQDEEFFNRYIAKTRTRIAETLEVHEE